MPDWTKPMTQTFEYYVVNPNTWLDVSRVTTVTSSQISWDSSAETLGSATFDVTGSMSECYLRIYLVTIQNGITESFPLGTFLVETPSESYDGRVKTISLDAYTPLIELKENPPPLGFFLGEEQNVMDNVCYYTNLHLRAPVIATTASQTFYSDFVANTDDTWLSFLVDAAAYASYGFGLDELSRIMYTPTNQKLSAMKPVWTYTDDNSSILYSDISVDKDMYGVPNVVEVIYSGDDAYYFSRVENNDVNSPTSIVNRGREITYRVSNPEFSGIPTQAIIDEYAKQLLETQSTLEYTIEYSHGYCPVRLGDCVRLNYTRAGLTDIKAKVTKQTITCKTGCEVSETAIYTVKLWEV